MTCTPTKAWLVCPARYRWKRAATDKLRLSVHAAGGLRHVSPNAILVPVDVAIKACSHAEVAAAVLEAMAGIPELAPYTGPPLPQAQPLLAAGELWSCP